MSSRVTSLHDRHGAPRSEQPAPRVRRKSRSAGISYVLAGTSFALGFAASVADSDWSWFSRSGSLVVVIGIVLTSTQIIEHDRRLRQRRLSWEAQMRKDMRRRATQQMPSARDWAKEPDLHQMRWSREDDEHLWKREHDGLYMLIVGTLVWGFGDLLALFFS
jgi:hypothetical protein